MKVSWRMCFKLGVSAFLLYIAIHYWASVAKFLTALIGAAFPIILGFAFAFILNITMSFYEKRYFPSSNNIKVIKSRRPVCLILTIITFILVITFIVLMVVPELISCLQTLLTSIPALLDTILSADIVKKYLPAELYDDLKTLDISSLIAQYSDVIKSGVLGTLSSVVSYLTSFFSSLVTFVLAFVFAIYFLATKESFKAETIRLLKTYLRKEKYEKIVNVSEVFRSCFSRFFVGQFIEAVILGSLCALGMMLLKIPYYGMIGALVGFMALIPIVGAFLGVAIGMILIVTVEPVKALVFLIFILILQQIEGNLIYPRVVGGSIELPAVWVLASITIGGALFGIIGIVISVPLTASLYKLVKSDIKRREAVS